MKEDKATVERILAVDFSSDFIKFMQNRVVVSHYKYGWASDNFPEKVNAVATALLEIQTYLETGNTEYLVDAANYLMFEFEHPALRGAHFRPSDSNQSPGSVPRKVFPRLVPPPEMPD
jgi:hypothetical protein